MAKGNNTKAKIARVAWKLFHEKGYEETTIDEDYPAVWNIKGKLLSLL